MSDDPITAQEKHRLEEAGRAIRTTMNRDRGVDLLGRLHDALYEDETLEQMRDRLKKQGIDVDRVVSEGMKLIESARGGP